ncbi:hypothetical protein OAV62_01300 [bacterium]|nr:hypothetical protein [bacterium]
MSYEEYVNRPTTLFEMVEIRNPDCNCCKYMSCDKCKCHSERIGENFKFEKEYIGDIWYPDPELFRVMCTPSKYESDSSDDLNT